MAQKAFEKAEKDKFLGTDDVSLVERLNKKVKIVRAGYQNIKAAYLKDLKVVKVLLENKRKPRKKWK